MKIQKFGGALTRAIRRQGESGRGTPIQRHIAATKRFGCPLEDPACRLDSTLLRVDQALNLPRAPGKGHSAVALAWHSAPQDGAPSPIFLSHFLFHLVFVLEATLASPVGQMFEMKPKLILDEVVISVFIAVFVGYEVNASVIDGFIWAVVEKGVNPFK